MEAIDIDTNHKKTLVKETPPTSPSEVNSRFPGSDEGPLKQYNLGITRGMRMKTDRQDPHRFLDPNMDEKTRVTPG